MKWNFKNYRVFITGSSSGLGYGLAKKFKENFAEVILNGRNSKKLKKSSIELDGLKFITADVTKSIGLKKIKSYFKKKNEKIDLLICNVGESNFKNNNFDFNHAFKYNFFSTINCVQELTPFIKKEGKILCISSICGSEVISGAPIGYSVAKSALNNYVKCISYELGKKKISINAISPGNLIFSGSTWEKKLKINKFKIKKYIKENVILNKFGGIDDIFNMIAYLGERKTKFITGTTFIIDGGQVRKF